MLNHRRIVHAQSIVKCQEDKMHDNVAMIVPFFVNPKPIEIEVDIVDADNHNRDP